MEPHLASITLGVDNTLGGTNGILRFDADFDLADARAITLEEGGGTIDTQGYTTNIGQSISGAGTLTKAGSGILNLNGANNYVGGTVLEGVRYKLRLSFRKQRPAVW